MGIDFSRYGVRSPDHRSEHGGITVLTWIVCRDQSQTGSVSMFLHDGDDVDEKIRSALDTADAAIKTWGNPPVEVVDMRLAA